MKIIVKTDEHKNISLRFPTGLLLNNITAIFIHRAMKKKGINLKFGHLRALMKALKRYKRKHKNWNLVEVSSSDGDYVLVKI